MKVNYNKLWKLLIDRNMTKKELREKACFSTVTLAKLGKNKHVNTEILTRICSVLDCGINDIVEIEETTND